MLMIIFNQLNPNPSPAPAQFDEIMNVMISIVDDYATQHHYNQIFPHLIAVPWKMV